MSKTIRVDDDFYTYIQKFKKTLESTTDRTYTDSEVQRIIAHAGITGIVVINKKRKYRNYIRPF